MLEVNIKRSLLSIVLFLLFFGISKGQLLTIKKDYRIIPMLKIRTDIMPSDSLSYRINSNKRYLLSKELPFFCKMEHLMSTQAKFPVRIRLRSLDYVNKLEGKYK